MAVVVIGGLLSSTLLTLLLIPVMYTILDDLQAWLGRTVLRRSHRPAQAEISAQPVGAPERASRFVEPAAGEIGGEF